MTHDDIRERDMAAQYELGALKYLTESARKEIARGRPEEALRIIGNSAHVEAEALAWAAHQRKAWESARALPADSNIVDMLTAVKKTLGEI
jgi:hypothetical protein